MTDKGKVPVFKVADLTHKRISGVAFGSGSVGLVGPDDDVDDFSPISPWVMVAKVFSRLDYLDRVDVAKLDAQTLDRSALDVGRAVVASKFFPGTAQCTIDMPTCSRNPQISPVASIANSVTNIDLGILRQQLTRALAHLEKLEGKHR
jgi:hypothetical protein